MIRINPATTPASSETVLRDNSPDSLYGSVLALEAVMSVLLADVAVKETAQSVLRLRQLRARAEELQTGPQTTKYGTGAELIADGIRNSLDTIFRSAEAVLQNRGEHARGEP